MKSILIAGFLVVAACGSKASVPPASAADPVVTTPAPDAADPASTSSQCPPGERYDECATSSCDGCEDCLGACVPI